MSELTTEQATEEIAREISKKMYGSEAMWELCLTEAYKQYYDLPAEQTKQER